MFCIVSYDISDNKRRSKLANILEGYGFRVQYSVFECVLDKKLLDRMTSQIYEVVLEKDDKVRIYTLCNRCEKNIMIIGPGEVTCDKNFYIL